MHIEDFRNYCLAKKGVEETFPFNETTLVFKVVGKVFALTNLNSEEFKINLKCEPERAIELREKYEEVRPGYHMNKKHWNTIHCEGMLDEALLVELIDHSYQLVVSKLKKADKEFLEKL